MKWFMEVHIEHVADQEAIKKLLNDLSEAYFKSTGDLLPAEITPMYKEADNE